MFVNRKEGKSILYSSSPAGMFWRFVPRPKAFELDDHRSVSVPVVLKEHFIRPLGSISAVTNVL